MLHTQWTVMTLILNFEAFESNLYPIIQVRELGKTVALVFNLCPDTSDLNRSIEHYLCLSSKDNGLFRQYKSECVSALTGSVPHKMAKVQQREFQHPVGIEPMSPASLLLALITCCEFVSIY